VREPYTRVRRDGQRQKNSTNGPVSRPTQWPPARVGPTRCSGVMDGGSNPAVQTSLEDTYVSSSAPDPSSEGRNETHLERCDRNLVELLQEVRVVQTGVQVLFGFMLMAPLTVPFHHVGARQHIEYYVAFGFCGVAAFVLMAPTAYHRVLFRRGDKEYLVTTANRLTIVGLAAIGLSMAGATVFVTDVLFGPMAGIAAGAAVGLFAFALWAGLPLARRRALDRAVGIPGSLDAAACAQPAGPAQPILKRR
jgi:hypothetical protein